jgi:hypothetical protein
MEIDREVIERQKLYRAIRAAVSDDLFATTDRCTEIAHRFAREYAVRQLEKLIAEIAVR